MRRPLKILISAGEASGDRLGAGLARALQAARPDVELLGMGGEEMAQAGVRLLQHAREVAVVGFVEVVRHLPTIRRTLRLLAGALNHERPDLFVPIDFPDFNLRLAAKAKAASVPVVYYVSPQVWAWRRGRVRTMRDLVRRMLVVLPFETAFYQAEGVPVTFVGHPAAASSPRASRDEVARGFGLDPARPIVALLPGSRVGEAGRLFPIMLDAASALRRSHAALQFAVPRASTIPAGFLEGVASGSDLPDLAIGDRFYRGLLEIADAGVVASGTATLDAALAGLPFAAVYRMQPLSYAIARALVRVDHIALPNLVAGRRVVPELVQDDCNAATIAATVAGFLEDPKKAETMRSGLSGVRRELRGDGAFDRAAAAVLSEAEV